MIGDWLGTHTPVTRHPWRYDTITNTYTAMLPLPIARGAGALVRVGRKLHFFGGLSKHYQDTADHWVLDLRNPIAWKYDPPTTPA